jgi:hypothetical protein
VIRRLLYFGAACLLAGGVAFWVLVLDPARRHLAFCQESRAELQSLAKRRPTSLSRQQWECVVAWTLNGHANILTFKQDIPQAERDQFLARLRTRLSGYVNLGMVDWVWDEFERLSPSYGPIYSGKCRPTSPERLKEFETPSSSWCIKVD